MGILQEAVSKEIGFLRAEAESRMVDTFDIKVSSGWSFDPTADNGKGKDVETYTLLFSTPGRVKASGLQAREPEVGDRTAVEVNRELHIPVSSPVVPVGAVAFCTAVSATSDPTLLGARLRITGPTPGSQTTARRMQVSEVLS